MDGQTDAGQRDPYVPLCFAGWFVVLRIYVALAVFEPYGDLIAGDNQSLKFKWRGQELNPRPLARQAKSLTTRPPPLHALKATQKLIHLLK